jgi:hypothetical protein
MTAAKMAPAEVTSAEMAATAVKASTSSKPSG